MQYLHLKTAPNPVLSTPRKRPLGAALNTGGDHSSINATFLCRPAVLLSRDQIARRSFGLVRIRESRSQRSVVMCPYRLLSYSESGAPPEAGVLIDGMIYRAAALLPDVENCFAPGTSPTSG